MPNTNNTKQSSRPKVRPMLAIGAAAIIVIIAALILWLQSRIPPLSAARLASDPSLGSASAKVTVIEYGDFGCTTCLGWERAES